MHIAGAAGGNKEMMVGTFQAVVACGVVDDKYNWVNGHHVSMCSDD